MSAAAGSGGAPSDAWKRQLEKLMESYQTHSRKVGSIEGRIAEKEAAITTLRTKMTKSGRGFDPSSAEGTELEKLKSDLAALNTQLGPAQEEMFRARTHLKDHSLGSRQGGRRRKTRRSTRA